MFIDHIGNRLDKNCYSRDVICKKNTTSLPDTGCVYYKNWTQYNEQPVYHRDRNEQKLLLEREYH